MEEREISFPSHTTRTKGHLTKLTNGRFWRNQREPLLHTVHSLWNSLSQTGNLLENSLDIFQSQLDKQIYQWLQLICDTSRFICSMNCRGAMLEKRRPFSPASKKQLMGQSRRREARLDGSLTCSNRARFSGWRQREIHFKKVSQHTHSTVLRACHLKVSCQINILACFGSFPRLQWPADFVIHQCEYVDASWVHLNPLQQFTGCLKQQLLLGMSQDFWPTLGVYIKRVQYADCNCSG